MLIFLTANLTDDRWSCSNQSTIHFGHNEYTKIPSVRQSFFSSFFIGVLVNMQTWSAPFLFFTLSLFIIFRCRFSLALFFFYNSMDIKSSIKTFFFWRLFNVVKIHLNKQWSQDMWEKGYARCHLRTKQSTGNVAN